MFGWLRRKRVEQRTGTTPAVSLADIPGALHSEPGCIPHVDWSLVRAWIATRPAREDAQAHWCEFQRQWADELAEAFGAPPYVWAESADLILWCARERSVVPDLLGMADRAYRATREIVGPPADASGKLVILCFASVPEFYDYIAPLFPEGSYGGIGGICIRDGLTHIALPDVGPDVEVTLMHEMVHVCLGDDVPGWLQEGVAQLVPEHVSGRRRVPMTEREIRRHRHHWAKRGLQSFWAGGGFTHDDRGQDLSYELAYVLVSILLGDRRDRLRAFLRAATEADFGAAAAERHLGMTLGQLAAQFLGPGDWEPSLDASADPEE